MEPESSERALIRTVIQRYFNAGDTGSSAELRQGFHPGAMMFWVSGELLARVSRARDSYDADLLGQSCHIRSTRLEVEQEQLVCVTLPEWQARWREKWTAGEVNTAAGSIVRLESCGAAAVAELAHDPGDSPLTEYALILY